MNVVQQKFMWFSKELSKFIEKNVILYTVHAVWNEVTPPRKKHLFASSTA